jgi:hypothetical protein
MATLGNISILNDPMMGIIAPVLSTLFTQGVLAAIGILLSRKIGLGLPYVSALIRKENLPEAPGKMIRAAVFIGLAIGVLLSFLELTVFKSALSAVADSAQAAAPPAWQGFLVSFYGGINEEILSRFVLLTLLLWLGSLISKDENGCPKKGIFWMANFIIALVFALGHLQSFVLMGITLSPVLLIRVITLNVIPALVYGWLYYRKGLESAIVAHFSTDIVIHFLVTFLV